MSSQKKPFNWPQIAVLIISAGVALFTGAQLAMAWPAMVIVLSQAPGGDGTMASLVLLFVPLAVVVLSAVAFIRLWITRSTLVAQVYLIGLFLLYSLATGLSWHFTDQVAWLDLVWLLALVVLFFALDRQERTRLAPPEQTPANT